MSDVTSTGPDDTNPLSNIPEELREAAKVAPDHWLGLVDPGWRGEGAPPRWTVAGEYRSGPEGEVVECRENEEYRPSPLALGWPKPTGPVDEAVQLASTGWGPPEDVPSGWPERSWAYGWHPTELRCGRGRPTPITA